MGGWNKYGDVYLCESTGAFLTKESCQPHLDGGAKKIVMSAPAKDDTQTFVMGVNEDKYAGEKVMSCASCTTNGLGPMVKIVNDAFGVDLTCRLAKDTTYEEICETIKSKQSNVVGYTEDALVSQDFVSDSHSTIFDAKAGIMLNPRFVKLVAWYDNEWGYSCRVVDLLKHAAKHDGVEM